MSALNLHMPTPDRIEAFYAQARELGVVMSDAKPTGAERPDLRAHQQHAEPLEMRLWRARRGLQPGTPEDVVQRAGNVRKAINGQSDDADLQARVASVRKAIGG